jgi:hypothetical protein
MKKKVKSLLEVHEELASGPPLSWLPPGFHSEAENYFSFCPPLIISMCWAGRALHMKSELTGRKAVQEVFTPTCTCA